MRAHHCDRCAVDVTNTCHISCAECPDYDLCVDCFSANETDHSRHAYRIIEVCSKPIIDPDWGADEELLLIEAAESCGLGNWQDTSDHLASRSKEEVEKHYIDCYIKSSQWPLPEIKDFDVDPAKIRAKKKARIEEKRAAAKLQPPPITKPVASVPACHEIQGYMPGRLEFETEWDNDAELCVKDMSFEPNPENEDPFEEDLKMTILDIYDSKLTKRAERRRVILSQGMLEYRKTQAIDKKRTREERELVNKTKPYARILSPHDYEAFVDGLLNEFQLRKRIAELQTWRRKGCLTITAGETLEREMASIRANAGTLGQLDRFGSKLGKGTNRFDEAFGSREATPTSATAAAFLSKPIRKPTNPLNISNADDIHLLSPAEQQLCSQLRILPKPYLVIKETLFRELLRSGGTLRKRQARELIHIDVNKTGRIFEFLQANGWLRFPT